MFILSISRLPRLPTDIIVVYDNTNNGGEIFISNLAIAQHGNLVAVQSRSASLHPTRSICIATRLRRRTSSQCKQVKLR